MISINNVYKLDKYDLYAFSDHNYTVEIDGKDYYLKEFNNFSLDELIASEFYRLLGVPCVFYKVAQKDDQLYLMSRSFYKDGKNYYQGEYLLNDYLHNEDQELIDQELFSPTNIFMRNNLELIWDMLEYRYPLGDKRHNDIRGVMVDLIKQYAMSIILLDADFHSNNWIIEEDNNSIKLAPKFDNECAFSWDISGMSFGVTKDDFGAALDSVNSFLAMSDKEDQDIFIDLFYKATPELLEKAINNINLLFNIQNVEDKEQQIIKRYNEIHNSLGMLIEKRGLTR